MLLFIYFDVVTLYAIFLPPPPPSHAAASPLMPLRVRRRDELVQE